MPHQCTTCGKVFPDGSKQMLSGCPSCGGNKFQFQPTATKQAAGKSDSDAADNSPGTGTRDLTSSAADAVRKRAADTSDTPSLPDDSDEDMTVSDWVNSQHTPEPPTSTESTPSRSVESNDSAVSPDASVSNTDGTSVPDTDDASVSDAGSADSESTTDPRGWGEWPSKPGEDDPSSPNQSSSGTNSPPTQQAQKNNADQPIRARIEEEEDNSQKSARSEFVSPEELKAFSEKPNRNVDSSPATPTPPSEASTPDPSQPAHDADSPASASSSAPETDGTVIEPSSDERPSLDELREELNDQFESIKILSPGQYELNLMELYDRDEYIISLKEDGRYVIEVPDSWGRDRDT